MSGTTPKTTATDQEARFFLAIIRNLKNKPEIDWDAVASEAGYSNGNTAQTRFGQIKRKLNIPTGNTPSTTTPAKSGVTKASGKRGGKSTGKAKAKSKAAQLLDEAPNEDQEPDDTTIPINYNGVKPDPDVEEEKVTVTFKNEFKNE